MKFFKYLLYFVLSLLVAGFVAIKVVSENKPVGVAGPEADLLANKVLKTLNKEAFDTIPYLQWEFFRLGQKYLWDKTNNKAVIEFDETKVLFNLTTMDAKCYRNNTLLQGDVHEKAKAKAWSNWCNDSFWMIAPFKFFDKGTSRKIVETKSGQALLIEYASGGVTPGDSYLWLLDENNRPTAWKMWTSIIPIKGIQNAWTGWENHAGAQLSTIHDFFGKEVSIKNVKTGDHISDFGIERDPLKDI